MKFNFRNFLAFPLYTASFLTVLIGMLIFVPFGIFATMLQYLAEAIDGSNN